MHVLVLQDETTSALTQQLIGCGHQVTRVGTIKHALGDHPHVDMALVRLELLAGDALDLCRQMREATNTPLIALTFHDSESSRVLCLRAGADDCLVEPFGTAELLARMEAVCRRAAWSAPKARARISRVSLHIDTATREVRLHEESIPLTRKEFDLLHALASSPGVVLSRSHLMEKVWGDRSALERHPSKVTRTVDTHVSTLRAKLGDGDWIITVRGIGFRIGAGCRPAGNAIPPTGAWCLDLSEPPRFDRFLQFSSLKNYSMRLQE